MILVVSLYFILFQLEKIWLVVLEQYAWNILFCFENGSPFYLSYYCVNTKVVLNGNVCFSAPEYSLGIIIQQGQP